MANRNKLEEMTQKFMPDSELLDLLKMNQQFIEGEVEGKDGFSPMLCVVTKDTKSKEGDKTQVIAVGINVNNFDEEKEQVIEAIGFKIATETEHQPWAVFILSEAWVRHVKSKDEIDHTKKVADYDDKQEAIVCAGLTVDRRTVAATYLFDRKDDNTIHNVKHRSTSEVSAAKEGDTPLLDNFYIGYKRGILQKFELNEEEMKTILREKAKEQGIL